MPDRVVFQFERNVLAGIICDPITLSLNAFCRAICRSTSIIPSNPQITMMRQRIIATSENSNVPVVAPGEMEQIKLTKEQLMKYPGLKTITVKIEEA